MDYSIQLGKTDSGTPVTLSLARLISGRGFLTGSSGAGKSYALRLIAERIIPYCQVIILDPDGEFPTLRERFDVVWLGDATADILAEVKTASRDAQILYRSNLSAVCDLSALKEASRAEWIARFCDTLMAQPRETWHRCLLILDEAHRFAGTETKTLPSYTAVSDVMSGGRKHKLGLLMATTRIAKLAANARADAATRFVGYTIEDLDIERGAELVGLPRSERGRIRGLENEFFGIGKALSPRGTVQFKFDAPTTSHPDDADESAPIFRLPPASPDLTRQIRKLWNLPESIDEWVNSVVIASKNKILLS